MAERFAVQELHYQIRSGSVGPRVMGTDDVFVPHGADRLHFPPKAREHALRINFAL